MPSKRRSKRLAEKNRNIIKNNECAVEKVPKVIFKVNKNLYPARVTRSLTKMLDDETLDNIKDFIIIEVYRCMPLLGDEEKQAPDWTVHIVRYDIVFIDKH